MAVKVRLVRSWENKSGRVYPVGSILQCTTRLASDLILDKYAEKYLGDYPPKGKLKINLSQLNKK